MPYARTTWLVVAVVVVLVAGVALALRAYRMGGDVPLFRLDLWRDGMPLHGQIMLRREAESSGGLLIKHSKRPEVYAYDPAKRSMSAAAQGAWERATGAIVECEKPSLPDYSVLHIDGKTLKLMNGSREVETAGKTVLALSASPRGRLVAVHSSTGSMTGGLMPALAGGHPTGQRLHQTFILPDVKPTGASVRLPVRSNDDHLQPCWSADERFVVYYDQILFFYLSIVEVEPPSTPK
jgi:hypothetical protein